MLRRLISCICGPNPVVPLDRFSVSKRVAAYAVPVVVLSVAVNIPKFLETRVVIERTQDPDTGQNVTNYSFDVTELRWVGHCRRAVLQVCGRLRKRSLASFFC